LVESGFERPSTLNSADSSPTNDPPEFVSQPHDTSDDEHDENVEQRGGNLSKKKGGYDSRVEQILCENEDLQIVITDAGKSQESGASYIVYTIKTGVSFQANFM
jgi:sorting nexin-41/42